MNLALNHCKSVTCVVTVVFAMLTGNVHAQKASAPAAFSFDVYGDSRSMMYLPHMADQEAEARKLMANMFELVFPPAVADAVVQKHVKLTYDPATKELVQMVMPFMTASQVTTLKFDKGWVTEASVEDVKLLPGVSFTMYHAAGGEWVAREVVKDVESGQAKFLLSTGDLIWWAKQGDKPSDSPYWKLVNEDVLKQLPPPDKEMQAAGLPGRVFPAVGNHELWGDTDVEGLLTIFPYLKKFGVSDKKLIYSFDYEGVRFIFLWTGEYDDKDPSAWNATQPIYEEQMKQLRLWLGEAKAKGIKKVFISFHAPAFARSGLGPIPEAQNPHKTIAAYAKDLDIVVFNGHVHTTELYQVDGVKYLLLGGGGAEQDPILPGRTHNKVPEGYPVDQYWEGGDPKEDYNYLHVEVTPGQLTKFTLNRFRPWSAQPFAKVELFK
ncbi:MAG TPA: metallophosphoesterase [Terriglobales bacterium]|nr:metallophosphoesterase [Terriglobales bacterium]